jgi:hypothetical protein
MTGLEVRGLENELLEVRNAFLYVSNLHLEAQ